MVLCGTQIDYYTDGSMRLNVNSVMDSLGNLATTATVTVELLESDKATVLHTQNVPHVSNGNYSTVVPADSFVGTDLGYSRVVIASGLTFKRVILTPLDFKSNEL